MHGLYDGLKYSDGRRNERYNSADGKHTTFSGLKTRGKPSQWAVTQRPQCRRTYTGLDESSNLEPAGVETL